MAYQYKVSTIDPNAPIDFAAHFSRGGGKQAVARASGNNWKPYEPLKRGYRWTTGVCGDKKYGRQDHKKGGKYYYDGKKVARWSPGSVVDFEVDIVVHHNGYFEFYLCNLDSCGTDDVEQKCFRNGHCVKLERAYDKSCERGYDRQCGPIDRQNKGRWYIPCNSRKEFLVGGRSGKMKYKIPSNFKCRNCVVQFYWVTGNFCNVPGYVEYFTGKNGPKWPKCRGQGNSRGGYNVKHGPCGGRRNPEEYWSCADVSIGYGPGDDTPKSYGKRSLARKSPRRRPKLPKRKPARRRRRPSPRKWRRRRGGRRRRFRRRRRRG